MSDLSIVKLVAGGDGLGFLDGKAVFVPDTLPGENVRVRVTQRHRDFDRAALLEVREPSPHRVSPPCRLAGTCGGCNWLHIRYAEQLAQKVAIVQEALRRVGTSSLRRSLIDPSPELGSRSRAQIHRQGDTRGYMAARSNQLVKVETCPIVASPIDAIFQGTVPVPQDRERFTVFSNGVSPAAVEGIDDDRDLTVSVRGRPIVFSVGCFFQSNLAALDPMIPWALGELSGEVAADLYCGVGLFGAFLSRAILPYHLRGGERNGCRVCASQRHGHRPRVLPDERGAVDLIRRQPAPVPDTVIVDPPRVGLGPEVREWLCRAKPAQAGLRLLQPGDPGARSRQAPCRWIHPRCDPSVRFLSADLARGGGGKALPGGIRVSRAFVDESASESSEENAPELKIPLPPGAKNYMTPEGARRLRVERDALLAMAQPRLRETERRIQYLSRMAAIMEVVEPGIRRAGPRHLRRLGVGHRWWRGGELLPHCRCR